MRPVCDHFTIHATLAIPRRPGHVSVSRNIHAIMPEVIELGLIDSSPLYAASHVDEMVSYFTAFLTVIFDRLASITCVFHPTAP